MWNRVEVKAKGKAGFKRNYWNCVVVSLLFTLVSGGLSGNEQRITRQIEENYVDPAPLLGFITTPKVIGGAAVGLAIVILVFGALEVGCSRFFLLNQLQPASVSEMGYGFSHNYGNNVGTILLRNVFVILGVILFIIPGVIATSHDELRATFHFILAKLLSINVSKKYVTRQTTIPITVPAIVPFAKNKNTNPRPARMY